MGNEPRESLTAQDFYDLKILNTQPSAKLNTQPQDDSDEKYSSEMTRFKSLNKLLNANILWSKAMYQKDVNFFTSLSLQQSPKLCWIGCSDSRVPANQIVSLAPGEIFVHRNIANVVQPTDLNVFSVLEYAIEVLKVEHVMVVGHYGCGGVMSAMKPALNLGCLDLWLRSVKDLYEREKHVLDKLQTIEEKGDLLCELNVANSVCNIGKSYILQRAWGKGQQISIHGWCYRITDGILKDLGINVTGIHDLDRIAIRS